MAWANALIAVAGTILGYATSAVVTEIRHTQTMPSGYVASAAQPSTAMRTVSLARYRSVAFLSTTGAAANQAPKVLPLMALAAGPNGLGEGRIR